jgi:hypothetical protein
VALLSFAFSLTAAATKPARKSASKKPKCTYHRVSRSQLKFSCPAGKSGFMVAFGEHATVHLAGKKAEIAWFEIISGRVKPAPVEKRRDCLAGAQACACQIDPSRQGCELPDCCATPRNTPENCHGTQARCDSPSSGDICSVAAKAAEDPLCQAHPLCSYWDDVHTACQVFGWL